MKNEKAARVAVVHDWLNGMRGGEAVLEAILELYPQAEIFTLVCEPAKISEKIKRHVIHTSRMQTIPGAVARYRHFLPLMPKFIESFDLRGFDLIISSSHCVAKGIRKPAGAVHVAYVHAPMRYVWDRFNDYFGAGRASLAVRIAAGVLRGKLQKWDRRTSSRENIDLVLSNSRFIADRILEFWGREAKVVNPFVDFARFSKPRDPKSFYLVFGAFAPYKRIDLAIEAFRRLQLPLVIAGGGQEVEKIRYLVQNTKIELIPHPSNEEVNRLLSECRALVFPGIEDFGITPLEAMAAGAPVIAIDAGGARETVTKDTGVFFGEQTVDAVVNAVLKIEQGHAKITEQACRKRAADFSKTRFQREFLAGVDSVYPAR
ncbi:MAG: glycosyltransferase [Cryobacterium sp.]|nr:glycosyltransferase [Oligoflexia bacterium]